VGAREILLLGDPIAAMRMYELGMISHIADESDFETTLNGIVQRLVSNAPLSLKAIKALLLREMTFRDGIEHADVDTLARAASRSEDAKEGKAARLAKRDPAFRGH
jgi:enoyl-CoA hydratase/carnithine racemase